MSLKRTVARNVIWNWAGTATQMIAGFIVFPLLIQRLGVSDCGLWLLIVSLTGYFDLLDLGLRGSLGRNIAFFRAKGDSDGVNAVFNTGLYLLCIGGVLVLLATALIQTFFFDLFAVRPEAQGDVRVAIWLIGLNLALIFPSNCLESVLWGHERFDLLNRVDIPCVILRTVLTFVLIQSSSGTENLVILALIILTVTILRSLGLAWFAFRVHPDLSVSRCFVRLNTIQQLFDFGIWCFLLSIANVISQQLGPFLIGARFGPALVTPFSAASRLVNYVRTILTTGTGVLTPVATGWHAAEEHGKQRWLFINGGKVCLALGLFFLGGFLFLGASFLRLWTGHNLDHAWALLLILMLGELLPLSQQVTYSTVLGMNRHRLWAVMGLAEVILISGFAAILVRLNDNIVSIALAVAIPGALCRGLIQMIYACRLLHVPLWHYLRRAMLPPALVAIVPMALLGALVWGHDADTWLLLVGYGAVYGATFALAASLLLGKEKLRSIAQLVFRRASPAPVEAVAEAAAIQSTQGEPA